MQGPPSLRDRARNSWGLPRLPQHGDSASVVEGRGARLSRCVRAQLDHRDADNGDHEPSEVEGA